jgi:hypothetical protein
VVAVSADLLRELYDLLAELHRDEASSNDWVQAVDDWFVAHGYPTIIYAKSTPDRERRGRSR